MDMGSKGLARDIIYNKDDYLAIRFNKSKNNASIILAKCICEMWSLIRIKARSREMMLRKSHT